MSSSFSPLRCLALLTATAVPVILSTGCGIGAAAPSQITSATSLSGMLHGGPNPVIGATVNAYATGTGGYGAAGTLLATTTTGSDGSFSFTGASTCTSPSQVYVTATGGNPGAGTNSNYMLMAALGDCSTINTGTVIYINEVTTVAAAYALSNFISISGSTVNVGAPTTNSVGTGSCSGTGGGMSCNAAGLKHAFQNALNLASSVGTAAAPPTGAAFFTIPGNSTAAQTVVPQALINSIANSIEVCVNSTGGIATDTSTPCGKLFSYTTPVQTSSTTPAAPTTTLQAAINMAKFPENNAANIYNLPTGFNTYYNPSLSAAPHDLSVGIAYKGVTISGTSSPFGYPYFLSLDANDNVYVITQPTSSGTNAMTAVSMTSNGAGNWVSATINGTTACQAGVPCISAPDTTGNLWLATGSTTAGKLFPISTAAGAVGTALTVASTAFAGVAIDKSNDVYVSVPTASAAASIYVLPAGTSSLSPVQATAANFSTTTVPLWLALDSSANLWLADKYTASTNSVISELIGPTTPSAFATGTTQTVDTVAASTGGDTGMYGLVTNSTGTAYGNNGVKLFTVPPTNLTQTTTTITDGTASAVSARYSAIDGNGNVFLPDNNGGTSYTWQYLPPSGTYAGGFMALLPCINTASGATTCGSSATGSTQGPRNAAIDSTGSVWVSSSTNGNVVQIIGTAAPTWPQLSYLKYGVTP